MTYNKKHNGYVIKKQSIYSKGGSLFYGFYCDNIKKSIDYKTEYFSNYININSNRDKVITEQILNCQARMFGRMNILNSKVPLWKKERVIAVLNNICSNCNNQTCKRKLSNIGINTDDLVLLKYHAIPKEYMDAEEYDKMEKIKDRYRLIIMTNEAKDYIECVLIDPYHLSYPVEYKNRGYKHYYNKVCDKCNTCISKLAK